MAFTVREFARQVYRSISSNSPTVPLHGDDQKLAITVLNQRLSSFAANGLLLPVGKSVSYLMSTGQEDVTFGGASVVPAPDVTEGRLCNVESAYLIFEDVTYPLFDMSRAYFNGSFKYNPLQGLPRFFIFSQNIATTQMRIYPAPAQGYDLNVRGKFQVSEVGPNDDLSILPDYMFRFLLLATSRDLCIYKGRMGAWTPELNELYKESKLEIEAASEIDMSLVGDDESLLNGATRVRAGV